jgi:hypothetical protein
MNGQMEIERLLAYHHLLVLEGALAVRGKKSTLDIDRTGHLLRCEEKQLAWKLFKAACLKSRIETDIGALRLFHATITRVLEHAAIRSDLTLRRLCLLAALRSKLPIELVDTLMRLLRVAGLQESGSGPLGEAHEIMMKPTIDSDLTISFTSDVVPVDGKDLLHVIAIVRTVDVVTSYEVNRATILRAFDNGLSTEQLCSYLKGLTGSLPLSLERLINQWREEFSRITIYDGVVVKTDERLGRILKAHPSLREHLLEEISPDVFLFPRNTEQQWRQIIASTGIGVLPSSIGTKEPQREEAEAEKEPEVFDEPLARALHDLARTRRSEPAASEPVFLDELREAINKKTLSRAEREELLARLERKLILLPSQIAASDGRTQTMEASGFDYQGKINLSKATVNSAAYLLELSVLDPDGTPQVLMTEVKEFIKDAREAAIRVRILPAGEEKVFSIGKIFRMRRLRRSIFLQV